MVSGGTRGSSRSAGLPDRYPGLMRTAGQRLQSIGIIGPPGRKVRRCFISHLTEDVCRSEAHVLGRRAPSTQDCSTEVPTILAAEWPRPPPYLVFSPPY